MCVCRRNRDHSQCLILRTVHSESSPIADISLGRTYSEGQRVETRSILSGRATSTSLLYCIARDVMGTVTPSVSIGRLGTLQCRDDATAQFRRAWPLVSVTRHAWGVLQTRMAPRLGHKTRLDPHQHTIPYNKKTKLRGCSPQANYTDRATAACRRG
jgi:hypothetical protein